MGSENYVSSGDPRWRVDVRLSPVDPPGVLRHSFADELPQARIGYVGRRPTERLNSRRPSQACGGRGKARKLRRWSTSSWPNNGRKRWGLVQTGGSTSRGLFGPMLPCPASVGGGGSGGAACYHRPQRHVPASGQSSPFFAIESIWQSPMGPMRKPTRGQPETKMRPPMRESRQSLGALSAPRPAAIPGIVKGDATSFGEASSSHAKKKTRPQGASGAIGECSPARLHFSLATKAKS